MKVMVNAMHSGRSGPS